VTHTWTLADQLSIETLDDSVVVYDLTSGKVHCLQDDTQAVFAAAVGRTTSEIASATGLSPAVTQMQLNGLAAAGLLVAPESAPTRRAMLTKAAVGAGLAMVTIAAPAAAAAGSGWVAQPVAPPPAPPASTSPPTNSVATPSTGRT